MKGSLRQEGSASWAVAAAIVLLALLVRGVVLALLADIPTVNDENIHAALGVKVAAGARLGDAAGKAPGVTLFYALIAKLVGPSLLALRCGNIVVSSATAGMIYAAGQRIAGRRAGIAAGVGAALYPTLVGFSHCLWAETLYLFFVVAALWAILDFRRRPSWPRLVAAGLCLGLAALTREVGLVLTAMLALFLWWDGGLRRGALHGTVVVAAAFLVVLPWSLHLWATTGDAALVTRTTWLNLYVGNEDPRASRRGVKPLLFQYHRLGVTRSEREQEARRRTLAAIAGRMPWWPIEKLVELRDLLAPTSMPVRRLLAPPKNPEVKRIGVGEWRYEFRFAWLDDQRFRVAASLVVVACYVGVAIFGAAGLVLLRDSRTALLLGAVLAAHVGPVLLAFGSTRFRLPIEPVLLLAAACAVTALPGAWREASIARRWLVFASGLGVAIVIQSGHRFFLSPFLI